MFGIGELHRKVNRLEICLQGLDEKHARDVYSLRSDIHFIVQKLAELEIENNKLKQQLLKEKGRVVLTICNSSLHQ